MINKKYFIYLFFTYFLVRIFSFFFTPETPLYNFSIINTIFSIFLLLLSSFWIIKKDEKGWILIMIEILLGGGGNLLDIAGISLRTFLLLFSLSIFLILKIKEKDLKNIIFQNKIISFLIIILFSTSLFSAFRGIYMGHNIKLVWSDFSPYLFLFYFFPLRALLRSKRFQIFAWSSIFAMISANMLFVLFTFFGFSKEFFIVQGDYYHWFRDVALGKITNLGAGFYRLVLNEHLWLPSITVIFTSFWIKQKANIKYFIFALLLILSISITRIYILALFLSLLTLFSKKYFKWMKTTLSLLFCFLLIFISLNLLVSNGQNFGLDLLGLKIKSVVRPTTEESSFSRILLLPDILSKIKTNTLLGTGLGDTAKAYSPVFKKVITTQHFDWGYLEIFAEMGLFGFISWFALIFYIFYLSWKLKRIKKEYLGGLMAILIINITSPALFHSLGIIFLITLLALITKNDILKTNYDFNQRTIL